MNNDVKILRELAARYAVAANDDRNYERKLLHKAVNDLHMIRPVVLIDELPWNELNGEGELTLYCEDPFLRTVEQRMRQTLYKWNHFPADMIITPYFGIEKVIHTTGNGVDIVENTLHADESNPSMLTNASYGGTMITSPSCKRISSLILPFIIKSYTSTVAIFCPPPSWRAAVLSATVARFCCGCRISYRAQCHRA